MSSPHNFYVHAVQPASANDNVLGRVRPLTAQDMTAILDEHGPAIGAAIDDAAQHSDLSANPYRALSVVLLELPELQRWIVWYGSDLRRHEVDKLQEGGSLVAACAEVIGTTKAEYTVESVLELLLGKLWSCSQYLAERESR